MDWKALFEKFAADVETYATSPTTIKAEIDYLNTLAVKTETASAKHPLVVQAEKFFFAAAIKFLQSKI